MFCFLVAQKIVATRKKQQLSIGPCKSLPNSPSHSSVCSAQVSAVHISQVQPKISACLKNEPIDCFSSGVCDVIVFTVFCVTVVVTYFGFKPLFIVLIMPSSLLL